MPNPKQLSIRNAKLIKFHIVLIGKKSEQLNIDRSFVRLPKMDYYEWKKKINILLVNIKIRFWSGSGSTFVV